MKFNFTKMHGIGNDYVYVNCMDKELPNPGEISKSGFTETFFGRFGWTYNGMRFR